MRTHRDEYLVAATMIFSRLIRQPTLSGNSWGMEGVDWSFLLDRQTLSRLLTDPPAECKC